MNKNSLRFSDEEEDDDESPDNIQESAAAAAASSPESSSSTSAIDSPVRLLPHQLQQKKRNALPRCCLPRRWILILMAAIAYAGCQGSIQVLTDHLKALGQNSDQPLWTVERVTTTLLVSKVGLFVGAVPCGYWSWRHGFKIMLAIALPLNLLLTAATPLFIDQDPGFLYIIRFVAGISEAALCVAPFALVARWIPMYERSRAVATVFSGNYVGTGIGLQWQNFAGHRLYWPAYATVAGTAFVWLALWLWLSVDSPSGTTYRERQLIFETVPQSRSRHRFRVIRGGVPFRRLASNPTVLALLLTIFAFSSSLYIFMHTVPNFMNFYHIYPQRWSLLVNSLPYPLLILFAGLGGIGCDLWIRRRRSPTLIRQIVQVSATTLPTAILVLVAEVAFSPAGFISLTLVAIAFTALNVNGCLTCVVDACPNYASLVYSVMLCFWSVPQVFCSYLYPFLRQRFDAWLAPMVCAGIINLVAALFFVLFAVSVPVDSGWFKRQNALVTLKNDDR